MRLINTFIDTHTHTRVKRLVSVLLYIYIYKIIYKLKNKNVYKRYYTIRSNTVVNDTLVYVLYIIIVTIYDVMSLTRKM